MSSIRKTLAFDEYFWNTYIDHQTDNLSQYIRKYVILGVESEINKPEEYKKRIIELVREKDNLTVANKTLKASIESLKARKKKEVTEENIVSKYGLTETHFDKLVKDAQLLKKDPAFFDGRYNLFKNETGINMKRSDFDFLIKSLWNIEKPTLKNITKFSAQKRLDL